MEQLHIIHTSLSVKMAAVVLKRFYDLRVEFVAGKPGKIRLYHLKSWLGKSLGIYLSLSYSVFRQSHESV